MSFISIDEDESVLMLKSSDFPNYYVDFLHPNDYNIVNIPFIEKIFHKKRFHNRLLIRMCFKIDNNSFLPLTFIIDTGCPMYFYLCQKAKDNIKNIIKKDEFETEYVTINGNKNFTVDGTSGNVNIIGLMALNYFGMLIENNEFEFIRMPEYF